MSGLLSPELLANIGKTSAPRLELVTRKDIRKYAIATQQRERGDVGMCRRAHRRILVVFSVTTGSPRSLVH